MAIPAAAYSPFGVVVVVVVVKVLYQERVLLRCYSHRSPCDSRNEENEFKSIKSCTGLDSRMMDRVQPLTKFYKVRGMLI